MSQDRNPLTLLADFGPLTRETLAKALDAPWIGVVAYTEGLQAQGLAVALPGGRWDATDAGRASLELEEVAVQ